MNVLVTGGAGYIGSHTLVELIESGHSAVVIDNLSNSCEESLRRVKKITGADIKFYKGDLLDKEYVNKIFDENKIDAVIHFAGLKAVGESVAKPLWYYQNNLISTLNLCEVMAAHNCKKLVFSSSATVYGKPASLPITEDFPLSAINPYGQTKLTQEYILKDLYVADNEWDIIILRYFNPVGAHKSGLIGEDPNGIPNNLVPYIAKVSVGKLDHVNVFGDDYDTPDGTGVRDYIHVVDLAIGHVKSIEKLKEKTGVKIYNLGTGNGFSVLQMINAYGKAAGKEIPYVIGPRRPGDIDACYADTSLAEKELGFKATKNLDDMCKDSFKWQEGNENGYK